MIGEELMRRGLHAAHDGTRDFDGELVGIVRHQIAQIAARALLRPEIVPGRLIVDRRVVPEHGHYWMVDGLIHGNAFEVRSRPAEQLLVVALKQYQRLPKPEEPLSRALAREMDTWILAAHPFHQAPVALVLVRAAAARMPVVRAPARNVAVGDHVDVHVVRAALAEVSAERRHPVMEHGRVAAHVGRRMLEERIPSLQRTSRFRALSCKNTASLNQK